MLTPTSPYFPPALRSGTLLAPCPQIWALGNLDILTKPLLGFFCATRCPGSVILRTYDLAVALREAGVPVIGGFHTPMEKECLEVLLRGQQPVVIWSCPQHRTPTHANELAQAVRGGPTAGALTVSSTPAATDYSVSRAQKSFCSHAGNPYLCGLCGCWEAPESGLG